MGKFPIFNKVGKQKKNFSSKKVVEMFAGMPNSPYLCNRIKRNASYNNKTKS